MGTIGARAAETDGLAGPGRQQWHRSGQGDPLGAKMGVRDVWRRESDPIYRHGHAGRLGGKCGLHPHGGPVR